MHGAYANKSTITPIGINQMRCVALFPIFGFMDIQKFSQRQVVYVLLVVISNNSYPKSLKLRNGMTST